MNDSRTKPKVAPPWDTVSSADVHLVDWDLSDASHCRIGKELRHR